MVNLTGYKLTFDDEFNTFSVSPTGVGTDWASIRSGSQTSAYVDGGFGASAFVDPASGINPFSLANGALTITERNVGYDPASVYGQNSWASGLIQSSATFSQTYGYFEMRAELPADVGAWPAFWMLREDGTHPPEFDVVETYGPDATGVSSSVHTMETGSYQTHQIWSSQVDHSAGYHTYGMMWTATTITFYFDGQPTGQMATPADAHSAMYLVANLALYPGYAGETSANKSMEIDYIRAYSADAGAQAVALQTISSPDKVDTSAMYGATALQATATTTASTGATTGSGTGATTTTGSTTTGSTNTTAHSTLVVHISGDSWNGSPHASISLDGVTVASGVAVTADHASGQWQDITLSVPTVTAGAHVVSVSYGDDANSGAYYDPAAHRFVNDRNLFVGSVTLDGISHGLADVTSNTAASGFDWLDPNSAVMAANGVVTYGLGSAAAVVATTSSTTTTTPPVITAHEATSTPVTTSSSTASTAGTSSISVTLAGDSWNGAPHATILIDGVKVGGPYDVTADHASGDWQTLSLSVAKLASGTHSLAILYDNDANSGAYYDPAQHRFVNDRNIFVEAVTVDGTTYHKADVSSNTAASGFDWLDPSAAVMAGNGVVTFGGIGSTATVTASSTPVTAVTTPAATAPATTPAATAAATDVKLFLSGDSWNGSPQFTLTVDGKGLGQTFTTTADHSAGKFDSFDLGNLTAGTHTVEVAYLNDGNSGPYYDPVANKVFNDRNIFVDHFQVGAAIEKALDTVTANTASIGWDRLDSHAAVMAGNGIADFLIHV